MKLFIATIALTAALAGPALAEAANPSFDNQSSASLNYPYDYQRYYGPSPYAARAEVIVPAGPVVVAPGPGIYVNEGYGPVYGRPFVRDGW